MFWGLGCGQALYEQRCQLRPSPKKSVVGFWLGSRWFAGITSFLCAGVTCFCVTPSIHPWMRLAQPSCCVVIFCFGLRPSWH